MSLSVPSRVPVPSFYSRLEGSLGLGNGSRSSSYIDGEMMGIVVVPHEPLDHDYDYSTTLWAAGQSVGRVILYGEEQIGIGYDPEKAFVPLGELVVANLRNHGKGMGQDLRPTFDAIAEYLRAGHRLTGRVPSTVTIDSIIVSFQDKATIEIVPPFSTSTELTPDEVLNQMSEDVSERDELSVVRNNLCHHFAAAALRLRLSMI